MSSDETSKRLLVLRSIAVFPYAVTVLAFAFSESFRTSLIEGCSLLAKGDIEGMRDWASGYGVWAAVATSLLMIAQAIVAPIPAVLITITNSLLFGPFWGGVLSVGSANLAASMCFGIGRGLGGTVVEPLIGKRVVTRSRAFVDEHGTTAILVARLLPFVPFDPISYVAGLAGMRFWRFFWATLLGQLPAGMVYSYLASDLAEAMSGGARHTGFVVLEVFAALAALAVVGWSARRWLLLRR